MSGMGFKYKIQYAFISSDNSAKLQLPFDLILRKASRPHILTSADVKTRVEKH